MKRIQKTVLATALMTSMFSLSGCGDNASSNGGVMSTPPANTKATVTVGNISDQTYARGILLDQNGNALASQEINCKAKDNDCKIYVPAELNQPVTLIVQDGQGHLLGAFQAKGGQANAETLYPSPATTGIYLTEQLERKYLSKEGISIEQANARLRTFFQAYQGPGAIDFNVLIAAYMAKQHATNPGLSDAQVLEALAKRLKDGEVAKPEEFSPPKKQSAFTTGDKLAGAFDRLLTGKTQLISAAHAQETCSGGLSTFLTVTSNLGDVFPIAGDVVSGLAGIGQEACDDTSAKLDKLSSQIQALAQSVDKVGENLMKAKGLAEDGWINAQTQKFKDGRNLVVKHKKAYNDFLNQNRLANNVKASSLEEWFKANGGWEASLKKDGAEASLMPILKSMNVIIEQTTGITEDNSIKTYFQALNDKCKDSNGNAFTPGLNFIAVRQQCNNAIFASAAYVVSYREALPMAKDIFSVLAKYQKEVGASVFNKVGFPKPATDLANKYSIDFDSYDTAYAQTKKTFDSQQTEFLADAKANVGHGGKGYFEAFEGLPPELLTNLAKVQCNQIKSPDTPSIVGWFAPSADTKKSYIITSCSLQNLTGTKAPNRITARYYYNHQDGHINNNDVINILGVPVARARTEVNWFNPHASVRHSYGANLKGMMFETQSLVAWNNTPVVFTGKKNSNNIIAFEYFGVQSPGLHFYSYSSRLYKFIFKDDERIQIYTLFHDKNNNLYNLILFKPSVMTIDTGCITGGCSVSSAGDTLIFDSGFEVKATRKSSDVDGLPLYVMTH